MFCVGKKEISKYYREQSAIFVPANLQAVRKISRIHQERGEQRMKNEAVKLRRDEMEKWMKCSLCNNLFTDATTISECLHTFCKECISKKLSDEEEFDCCPICDTDLGPVPLQKLRPDPNIQELRAKIFTKKRKINMSSATILKVPTQSPDTSNSSEGKRLVPSFLSLDDIPCDISESSEEFDDDYTDWEKLFKEEVAASPNIRQRIEPIRGLFPEFHGIGSAAVEMEKRYYQLIDDNQKLKAELASSASIASENKKLRAELVSSVSIASENKKLRADNQNLKAQLSACSTALNTALSDVESRLKAKEDELRKICDNFCLGVENEVKKMKRYIFLDSPSLLKNLLLYADT